MVAASKNWQRGKISTWPELKGGWGSWSKYKVVVVGVLGVFPYNCSQIWYCLGLSYTRRKRSASWKLTFHQTRKADLLRRFYRIRTRGNRLYNSRQGQHCSLISDFRVWITIPSWDIVYYPKACTSIFWDILLVLVYYVLFQIPSWDVMYHPKIWAGVLCAILGHVLVYFGLKFGLKTNLEALIPDDWSDAARHSSE